MAGRKKKVVARKKSAKKAPVLKKAPARKAAKKKTAKRKTSKKKKTNWTHKDYRSIDCHNPCHVMSYPNKCVRSA